MIGTVIVARVRLYRDGLALVLDAENDIGILGTASNLPEGLSLARRLAPDIVLLDVSEGRAAVSALKAAAPAVEIVATSITDAESDIVSWAEAGVSGYLTCDDSLPTLLDVVRSVARGEMPCSPRIAATLLRRVGDLASTAAPLESIAQLTRRELEIVEHIERGMSNKAIASELHIEVTTVKNHVHNILEKLHVYGRADAVARIRGRALLRGAKRSEIHA